MLVRLKPAKQLLIQHARSVPPECGYTTFQFEWRKILDKVGGRTLVVATEFLFSDQFNTVPIPGVSVGGIRVMNDMVEEIIDDVRPRAAKCNYCGWNALNVPDDRIGKTCDKCKHGKIGRIPIKPLR